MAESANLPSSAPSSANPPPPEAVGNGAVTSGRAPAVDRLEERWIDPPGVGSAFGDDPRRAAVEAVEQALGGREVRPRDVVLLFSAGYEEPVEGFQLAQRAAAPARVAACSSDGAFTAGRQVAHDCCAIHLSSAHLRLGLALAELAPDLAGATRRATELARAEAQSAGGEPPHAALVLLSDGLAGDQREIVRGAYEVTGAAVPIVGGAAGDDLRISRTYQHAGRTTTNGVIALWLGTEEPLAVVAHGWRPIGAPMLVTRAEGNVILELDGRPARDAQRIATACGTTRLCGFFTYGEFGRITGTTGFHNASVAVLALPAAEPRP